MQVSVVTPDKSYFDGEAAEVVLPAWDGEMGILPKHAPLIARLGHGVIRIQEKAGNKQRVAVYGGFVKVQDDVVTVLAGGAATSEGADAGAAQQAYDVAKGELAQLKDAEDTAPADLAAAEEKANRARAFLQLVRG